MINILIGGIGGSIVLLLFDKCGWLNQIKKRYDAWLEAHPEIEK